MEIAKQYNPKDVEQRTYAAWEAAGSFRGDPEDKRTPFCIVIPPPNVTGALHLGHAINNTQQDILIRYHRMRGENTLWLPGTDHAGIATQAVVEKKLLEEEGKTRHDLGRAGLVARIQEWKERFVSRIIDQLKSMGCSCDWRRTRFTLDDQCAIAVRRTFFKMFRDGLIYRGIRLVNWDAMLQTAVSDDEVYHETVQASLWYYWYPVKDSDERVLIATTRPETMLGDTAVAVHPDDERFKHLIGKVAILPLTNREIPIIADAELVDPEFGTGCVKVTPAHDPNDYECGLRNGLEMINILNPDGTINENGGRFAGMERYEARRAVVEALKEEGLLEKIEPYETQIGHSDRSKTPIEPYLSDQWFIKTADLAQAAMDAVTDGRVNFHPARYAKMYLDWLSEKRDWPISRQLWWGHRIPIWSQELELPADVAPEPVEGDNPDAQVIAALDRAVGGDFGESLRKFAVRYFLNVEAHPDREGWIRSYICLDRDDDDAIAWLEEAGWQQDPDVLDTWFSSGLWPHSTLGWPGNTPELKCWYPTNVLITSRDIVTLWVARMVMAGLYNMGDIPFSDVVVHVKILDGQGQTMSKSKGNGVDPIDIIEQYGADALRFSVAHMSTETQDVRVPVLYKCPHCEKLTPQTPENMTVKTFDCPHCGKPTATRWADDETQREHGLALLTSDKFEIGRNFANKIWNASRLALTNLEEGVPLSTPEELYTANCKLQNENYKLKNSDSAIRNPQSAIRNLSSDDEWILERLAAATVAATNAIEEFQFHDYAAGLYDFMWNEFCDWYLEAIKPALYGECADARRRAQTVLACVLRTAIRLLHPVMPYISEEIWTLVHKVVGATPDTMLINAPWPDARSGFCNAQRLEQVTAKYEIIRLGRGLRSEFNIAPSAKVHFAIKPASTATEEFLKGDTETLGRFLSASDLTIDASFEPPHPLPSQVGADATIYLFPESALDMAAEAERIGKQLAKLEGYAAALHKKLANEKFVSNAPADIVAAEREKLADAENRAEKLRHMLEFVAAGGSQAKGS